MKSLTDRSFDKNIRKSRYSAVMFFANCCGPSRMALEIFSLVEKKRKRVRFFTVNADNEVALARRCGVEIFPAILLFDRGELTLASYGVSGKKSLDELLDRLTK